VCWKLTTTSLPCNAILTAVISTAVGQSFEDELLAVDDEVVPAEASLLWLLDEVAPSAPAAWLLSISAASRHIPSNAAILARIGSRTEVFFECRVDIRVP